MVEKVDQYLNYVAENWMKENELAIERGLRTEITEDFIKSLQVVFKEHYIEVPEEKYDVLGEMEQQIEELKGKLNEQIEATVDLKGQNETMLRQKVIAEASEDLTLTEAEKLTSLLADVEFGDSEIFAEKVAVVKETYFPKQGASAISEEKLTDTVDSSFLDETSSINKYAQAISKQIKK
jgi:TolA-binding protein